MGFKNSFMSFFNKDYFDFDSDDISLHSFHPQLQFVLVVNGVFFHNMNSRVRYILPTLYGAIIFVASVFEIMFVFHGLAIENYAFATECFCYQVIMGTVPLVYISIFRNTDIILALVQNIESHFTQICRLEKYKKQFLKSQILIWKLCIVWFLFLLSIAVFFVGNTVVILIYQSLFKAQDEITIRPLIFPMWLPEDDPFRTPNYEVFFFFQVLIIGILIQCFGVYVYTTFHYLFHYNILMDVIILDFTAIFEGVDSSVVMLDQKHPVRQRVQAILNRRVGRIVTWHNDVFNSVSIISSVFGPPLVYQIVFTSIAVCVMAYQFVDQLENGKFDFLFGILLVATVVQLWIPCYLGTLIRDKGFAVGDAGWNCGWQLNPASRLLLNDITMIMMRAQRPVLIQFTALPDLTLETYSSIMRASYSYFNMLRQSTK